MILLQKVCTNRVEIYFYVEVPVVFDAFAVDDYKNNGDPQLFRFSKIFEDIVYIKQTKLSVTAVNIKLVV